MNENLHKITIEYQKADRKISRDIKGISPYTVEDFSSAEKLSNKSLQLAAAVHYKSNKIDRILNEDPDLFYFINTIESFNSDIFFQTYSKKETLDIWNKLQSEQKESLLLICEKKKFKAILTRLAEIENTQKTKQAIQSIINNMPQKQ